MEASTDRAIYMANRDALIRFASTVVGPADAEDVMIDGVVSAMRSRRWDQVENHRSYLYQSVLNAGRTHLRSTRRRRRREDRAHRLRLVAPPELPETDRNPELVAAVSRLSARQRAVVFLTYWEDLDERAVAERLGISVGSVRTHLHRARNHLEVALDA